MDRKDVPHSTLKNEHFPLSPKTGERGPGGEVAPTPYPDVNAVLATLLASIREVLGDQLVGLYLYGSLSSGDYIPGHSDIDFMAVTEDMLPAETIDALGAMHRQLEHRIVVARHLEGSYIPRRDLRRYDPAGGPYPTLNEGKFYVAPHGGDWLIQRHIVREMGVVVAGPPPHTLIDPVSPDDLRRGVIDTLQGWWAFETENFERLRDDHGYQSFAVLTMCRALYTLHHGRVASKPLSARWAQETLGEPRASLIADALGWLAERPYDRLSDTLDFIRETVEASRAYQIPAPR